MPEQEGTLQLGLNGKLVTAYDATKLFSSSDQGTVVDFKALKNMRYTDRGIKGIAGMTKVNTTALTGYEEIRSMYHFEKEQPQESHLLVQGYADFSAGTTTSRIYDNESAVPAQGNFNATYLHEEADGAGIGRFSDAPQSHICYCNNLQSLVWGGNEVKVSAFMVYDQAGGAWNYDYTAKVQNSKTDAGNIATLKKDATPATTIYIGNTLPIEAIKFYVGTANTATGTMTVSYWNGSSFQGVANPSDGTADGGKPLAQTGSFTFDSTQTVAKVSFREGVYAYWYKVSIASGAADDTTTITQCTVKEKLQPIKDYWDGNLRSFVSVQMHDGTQIIEQTTNVKNNSYVFVSGGDSSTYMDISSLTNYAGGGYIAIGSFERMMGFHIKFIPGHTNTSVATVLSIKYWDGSAWADITGEVDGTSEGGNSFTRSGYVTWNPNAENVEFRRSLVGEELLYYYLITFSVALPADVLAYYVGGIPIQKAISNYKFGLHAKNRLMLFSDRSGDKNSMIHSAINTLNVLNGKDSSDGVIDGRLHFGDGTEVQAAVELFTRFFSSIKSVIVVCKRNSTHVLEGDNPTNWNVVDLSNKVGCAAPNTMKTSSIGLEVESVQPRHVAIWLHSSGVYAYDSQTINIISDDIADIFDQGHPNAADNAINLTYIANSTGEFMVVNGEHYYHLCIPVGSTTVVLNKELVYDLKRRKWFPIDRGTGKYLQALSGVKSATGNAYAYGAIDTGYVERLWNGDDFDGEGIVSEYQTGDIAISRNNFMTESRISKVVQPCVAKSVSPDKIQCTHYADGATSGYEFELSHETLNTRVAIPSKDFGSNGKRAVFHSIKASITTDAETIGFEPLFLGIKYRMTGEVKNAR